jgi:hypothetical protein
MVEGPIRGAPLDPGPPPAAAEAPAAPAEPAPAAPGPPAAPRGENPEHGVKASAPAHLPEGTRYLTFEDVSWPEYEPPELRDVDEEILPLSEFPEALRELDGTRAAIDGYMIPVDFANRKVTSFILSRYLANCCFGVMPRLDEWIEVDVLVEGGVDYVPFRVVRVTGELEVGEVLDDYGYVRSLYRLRAEDVEDQL